MGQVAYQSSSTTAAISASDPLVFTKPSGLAVGDLLVVETENYSNSTTPPAGWSTIVSNTHSPDAMHFDIFAKIADAADVAASTFTFTTGGGTIRAGGAIIRITGPGLTIPLAIPVSSTAGTNASATALSTTTITPPAGALLLLFTAHKGATLRTVSGYAVATSNPSWTEAYDGGGATGGAAVGLSMAYATRGQITATGAGTATVSGANDYTDIALLAVIPAPIIPTAIALSTSVPAPTFVKVLMVAAISLTSTINAAVASIVTPLWRGEAKDDADWTAETKS